VILFLDDPQRTYLSIAELAEAAINAGKT